MFADPLGYSAVTLGDRFASLAMTQLGGTWNFTPSSQPHRASCFFVRPAALPSHFFLCCPSGARVPNVQRRDETSDIFKWSLCSCSNRSVALM